MDGVQDDVGRGARRTQACTVADKAFQPQYVALSQYVAQLLALGRLLDQLHAALLDDPDEITFGLALPEHVFLGLMKLHTSAAGQIEQVRLRQGVEGSVPLQKLGDAISNDGSVHVLLGQRAWLAQRLEYNKNP